ncbi:hypothetical protein ACSQ67_000706 [Phaseolus vulgaris]
MDIECYNSLRETVVNLAHERKLEAHFHVVRASSPAPNQRGRFELGTAQEGGGCEEENRNALCGSMSEGKEEGEHEEDEVSDTSNPAAVYMVRHR